MDNNYEKKLNWKQIFVSALVTTIVTVVAGIILFYFQTRAPHLVYSVNDTIPFTGETENLAIYHVMISNDGKTEIENVNCTLSFNDVTIKQKKVNSNLVIPYKDSMVDTSYNIEFPILNPNDTVNISILVSSTGELPLKPQISLRGKGLNGEELNNDKGRDKSKWLFLVTSVLGALVGLSFALVVTRKVTMKLIDTDIAKNGEHADEQKLILGYLCGLNNLEEEVNRYYNINSEISYWAESDRFVSIAQNNPSSIDTEKRKQVLIALVNYAAVAEISKGIIYYNIARIAKMQGNEGEYTEYMDKAKNIIPNLIAKRVEINKTIEQNGA